MRLGFRGIAAGGAFTLTGVGTALLGATLPAILHQWHLTDSRGGLLLLAAWGGSTAGSTLVRADAERSAGVGLALSAGALLFMAVPTAVPPFWLYLVYGLGLGLTMTAISLLRSHGVSPQRAELELNRLNLLWAAGACTAPLLAIPALHVLSAMKLFRSIAAVFGFFAAVLSLAPQVAGSQAPGQNPSTADASGAEPRSFAPLTIWAPLRFGFFAAASVGLESAIGSWLTTFTARSTHAVSLAVSANAAFWTGLLLSRAAHSLDKARWLHSTASRWGHIAAVGLATTVLVLRPGDRLFALAALVCGLGLGPLYPLVLSQSLPRYRSTAVFVLAGIGASVVPWLTGALSTAFGSLRLGLLALELAFALLLGSALAMRSDLANT